MTNRGRNFILACALAVPTLGGLPYHAAQAQPNVLNISTSRTHLITVEKGKPKTLRTQSSFYEIVVGDPEIANVQPLTNRSFYVLGITAGTTGIALFDENKRLIGSVDVEVSVDTTRLKTAIRENVPDADIKVTTTNGQVVLSGSAPDQVSADRAKKIASKFAGEDEDIINSVDVTSSQQVQLNVRFVEVNRNAGQELGVKINDLSYISNRNSPDSGSAGYSSVGNFVGRLVSGGLNVDVAIKAMEDRGVARRLAEPNLIARSGETASFLAGGEFPISVVGKDGDVSVQYKKFGVGLEFTPKVLKDGLISLEIEPEVSSLDRTLSNGFPVLSVRRAKTSVDLKSGQSFMMAGLYQANNDKSNATVPGARKLPVIGALFASREFQRRETDLVMIVTPHLVRPIQPGTPTATPLDASRPATTEEAVVLGVDEMRTSAMGAGAGMPRRTSGHILTLDIGG
ncbi:type II and III secretion system protein family protein [Oricola indica]|jgi:pilus assembly protein CpaC|uniref:type II and III secretion system protein family protein n=1 Tax=Oricola indica TaxID=2872591 RepID=UPI001CBDAA9E|nr:type II and III secretion system protein family protein [Oricola indica]